MMLQNPLFQEYNTALSQLLELHQQQNRYHHHQQQHQQHHHHNHHHPARHHHHHRSGSGGSAVAAAAGAFQTYATTGTGLVRTTSRDSAESDGRLSSSSPKPSCKPFTIDAILGLQRAVGEGQPVTPLGPADTSAATPVAALDFSTGSAAAYGKKHKEGNTLYDILQTVRLYKTWNSLFKQKFRNSNKTTFLFCYFRVSYCMQELFRLLSIRFYIQYSCEIMGND